MEAILSFPAKAVYFFIKPERSAEEFTAATVAVTFFSGLAAYYAPIIFTFSYIPSIILAKTLISYDTEDKEYIARVNSFSLAIIAGSCIGYLINHDCFNIDKSFFIPTFKTPFHLLNYYATSLLILSFPDNFSLGKISPISFIYEKLTAERFEETKKVTYLAITIISLTAAYFFPFTCTFSLPLTFVLSKSIFQYGSLSPSEFNQFLTALSLTIFGSLCGKTLRSLSYPTPYSWKTPIHIINSLIALVLFGLSFIDDKNNYTPVDLSDITVVPQKLKRTNRDQNLTPLQERINKLLEKEFKIDSKFKEYEDQQLAAHYILLVEKNWKREDKKKNYMALILCSAPDKNPEIDDKYYICVIEAAKILGIN